MRNQLIDFGNGAKRGFRFLMETPIDFEGFGNFTHFVDPSSETKEKKLLLLFEYVPVIFGEDHRKGGREIDRRKERKVKMRQQGTHR